MKIALTGATGFIGRRFTELAQEAGHQIIAFTRKPGQSVPGCVETREYQLHAPLPLDDAEAVIHLAGESVVGLWTKKKRERILESRVAGTRHVVRSILHAAAPPRVLISASAIGFYGDTRDETRDEYSPAGQGFLSRVVQAWERAAAPVRKNGVRLVLPRFAIVYGKGGGALRPISKAFQFGLGGKLGPGTQWISWIHLDDLCRLLLFCLERESVSGIINAGTPNPITNAEFTRTLTRVVHRPALLPAPAFALRALLGGFSSELLDSKRIAPRRTLEAGFIFTHPQLEPALRDLLDS
ncbi:MAG: TIGR01777 family oxidoreductase [Chthoniobacteraceae bacterium]